MSRNSSVTELEALQGLHAAKRFIMEIARKKSSVHAVMFYGSEGAGKRSLASILAKSWLCLAPDEDGACGECKTCQAFDRGQAIDVLLIEPKGLGSLVRLNQIVPSKPKKDEPPPVSILEFLRTGPVFGARKVVIMNFCHRMSIDASNALLKMLEEPHDYARFILTTDTVGQIRPTIRSRCHMVQCELPEPRTAGKEERLLVKALGDSPGGARKLEQYSGWYHKIASFANSLAARPRGSAIRSADEFRALCESNELPDMGTRAALCEGLKVLAHVVPDTRWTSAIVEAHRRVNGNGSHAAVIESLFTGIEIESASQNARLQ